MDKMRLKVLKITDRTFCRHVYPWIIGPQVLQAFHGNAPAQDSTENQLTKQVQSVLQN
jgi:hypothetical protein